MIGLAMFLMVIPILLYAFAGEWIEDKLTERFARARERQEGQR